MIIELKYVSLVKDHAVFIDEIVKFYSPRYKHPFTEKTVHNTAVICLAMDRGKIIGAVRAISDLSRHGQIVDLMVDEKYRRKKIGSSLIKLVLKELRKNNVKNIGITTETDIDWLPGFYIKEGFKTLKEGKYLEYEF